MKIPFLQRLYLRIWLAVVASVILLAIIAGWLSRLEAERELANRPGREIVLRNEAGEIIGRAPARPNRVPGQGPEFVVTTRDGSKLTVQLPRPPNAAPGRNVRAGGAQARPRIGFAWVLGLVALAVALGTYPVVRRLTKRLESLENGVRRWGDGDLSQRLPQQGNDEVAHLAKGFNDAAGRIETLLQSHKNLLANASHELRSPLTRIRMGLELMDGQPDARARDEIARNIQELDLLIDEILLASRLDTRGADVGTTEPVDLIGLAAEECARCGVELQVRDGASDITVQGVSRLLRRVLRNLLENAQRHAAAGVSLELHAAAGRHAEIRVCDRGPGVPEALRERIFEPFYRLPGASERDGGVGLGLALVKAIVERHGGTVSCRNRDGGGACFLVELPLAGHSGAPRVA